MEYGPDLASLASISLQVPWSTISPKIPSQESGMSEVHPISTLSTMSSPLGPAALVRCAAMSLQVMAPDDAPALSKTARESEDLSAFIEALWMRSTALLMGIEPCLNWASRAAFCRAAAEVLSHWMARSASRPELLAPEDHETLETATREMDRYIRRHWRAAQTRAWSAPVSGRLVSTKAA